MKLATLLFSGGVAAVAIARAGLAGCDGSAPAPAKTVPAAPQAAPAVAPVVAPAAPVEPAAPVTPAATAPVVAAPDVAAAGPVAAPDAAPAKAADAKAPAASNAANARELPARYLGGSKSDVDVWGGLPAEEEAAKKPAKGGGK